MIITRRNLMLVAAPALAIASRLKAAPSRAARRTEAADADASIAMTLGPVGNVFYFVKEFDKALAWYEARLGRKPVVSGGALAAFDINGTRLTIHQVDDINTAGPGGVATYWTVPDVDAVVAEWTKHGAKAHRGPKTVFTNERLCQLLDPFGNIFGIRQAATYDGPPPAPIK